MSHLEASKLFSVVGLVAVVTGGGSGKYAPMSQHRWNQEADKNRTGPVNGSRT